MTGGELMEPESSIETDGSVILRVNAERHPRKSSRSDRQISGEQGGSKTLVLKIREYGDTQLGRGGVMKRASLQRRKQQPAQKTSSNSALSGDGKKTQVRLVRAPIPNVGCDMRVRQHGLRSPGAGGRIPQSLVQQIPENRLICGFNLANRVWQTFHARRESEVGSIRNSCRAPPWSRR